VMRVVATQRVTVRAGAPPSPTPTPVPGARPPAATATPGR
jgi:hypothetical protein